MTNAVIVTNLNEPQAAFIRNAVADIWARKADKVEKQFDNCTIVVYRLLMIIRIDIRLQGLQP